MTICMTKENQSISLCFMDTHSFIVHVNLEDVYKFIAGDFEKKFHTSNYKVKRNPHMEKNRKVIELMKNELGEKINETNCINI